MRPALKSSAQVFFATAGIIGGGASASVLAVKEVRREQHHQHDLQRGAWVWRSPKWFL